MLSCPLCGQSFKNINQPHSCGEKILSEFLTGKSQYSIDLFYYLIDVYQGIGAITIHPAKSMISFAARKRFAYVIQIGTAFIDVVLPFKQTYADNLCFNKIKQVPGSDDFNHHLRIQRNEDINDEVLKYLKEAYQNGL